MNLLSPDVWFLAHPIAPDNRYRLIDNLNHIEKLTRLCFRTGVMVIAPYYLTCLALDDRVPADREMGMQANEQVLVKLRRIILTGHRLSSGMGREVELLLRQEGGVNMIDLVGIPDYDFCDALADGFSA